MFTIILAYINIKYKAAYELLFVATFILDLVMWEAIAEIFTSKQNETDQKKL